MGIGLLVSVNPDDILEPNPTGLTLDQIAYFGNCLIEITPDNFEPHLDFLRQSFSKLAIYVDVRKLKSWDNVIDILNNGASKIFVTFEQLKALSQEPTISPDRLVLTISLVNPKTDIAKLNAFLKTNPKWKTTEWAFDGDKGNDHIDEVLKELDNYPPSHDQTIFVAVSSETEGRNLLHEYPGNALIVSSKTLTFDASKEGHEKLIPAVELAIAGATADRKTGLYATTVVDERDVALGLVWSSKESIAEALKTGSGVYQSRKRGLWRKGATSGDTQELISMGFDCDKDCLVFRVRQKGRGFCHLGTMSCWGKMSGLSRLQRTIQERKIEAPPGSYTARLFNDPKLVNAKIKEEADELCDATSKEDIASEAADLLYFTLARCIAADVTLEDIERNLDLKSLKVKRRKGDAKPQYVEEKPDNKPTQLEANGVSRHQDEGAKGAASIPKSPSDPAGLSSSGRIQMKRYSTSQAFSDDVLTAALQRPSQRSNEKIMSLVHPIIADVRSNGDSAVLKYTHKFENATNLKSPVLKAPFPKSLMQLSEETVKAINTSYDNILKFHSAQKPSAPLVVETMSGVTCSRFARPIERVGLYIPGGTAVLPSTALMLGVPAMAAGCTKIVLASPPRSDGTITPEIVYIAHKVGAEAIVLAGGAQAIAAMAYGTESVSKVDKILGPGNQFVTAAKMIVSNDTSASVSIDMPAGPSEVLVIADDTADPAFVASDLLSQAEHGTDSQVVLVAIDLNEKQLQAIEDEVHKQAHELPRVDIVRGAIEHSVTICVTSLKEALKWSNYYAPEHLILQIANPRSALPDVQNAGSVFLGGWTPESVGDYSAGVNHSLPTYGYARQYSGVNLGSFMKNITSSEVTEQGVGQVGYAVMELARCEGLDAHRRAMEIRMEKLGLVGKKNTMTDEASEDNEEQVAEEKKDGTEPTTDLKAVPVGEKDGQKALDAVEKTPEPDQA
ncbi:histidinol dehydrogenase [Rhinocladiella mackenziei CBS 650.93]|uniref:Histidine biosynthesis trifunctional protein n=1 Tax=Rhinocladiella mackenziei CBS 650.93 TaxID=1442369 RepID=A0A0D2H255_9EURO|nr:histidinol dehydrogenase [Rhinocladiella mackenziei CBS 650.93]KIX04483.1 histidinol dehydrogenase [Rhinocladiella mackenziei CBS 650.93]